MGINTKFNNTYLSGCSTRLTSSNPDPNNYKIIRAREINGFLLIELQYPDCTNFEGRKILLYKCSLINLVNQKTIDPHFFNDEKIISPIARFIPTDEGWYMGEGLISYLSKDEINELDRTNR